VAEQLSMGNSSEAAHHCQTIATRMASGHPHPRWASYPSAERHYGKLAKAGKLIY
jgi:hypothetical protein